MDSIEGHTPTPWALCMCGKCGYIYSASPAKDVCTALLAPLDANLTTMDAEHPYWCIDGMPREERQANAALIVRAVNSHHALVEALTRIAGMWDGSRGKSEDAAKAMSLIAREALRLAGEDQS